MESRVTAGPRGTVLLATYDHPAYLRLALEGYARQSTGEFEVIVCDDGSPPDTEEMVASLAAEFPVPLCHVRQEDRGNRKGRILNEGASLARGRRLIFTDHDCIPHRAFVERHLAVGDPRAVGSGRVVRLGEELSRSIGVEDVRRGRLEGLGRLLAWSLTGRARAVEAGLYLGGLPRLAGLARPFHQLFGGNFSCSRAVFQEINGYDERFEGWGREDTDLGWRLRHAGVHFVNLKFLAVLYHLWHPPQSRERLDANDRLIEDTIATGRVRAAKGLDEHTSA